MKLSILLGIVAVMATVACHHNDADNNSSAPPPKVKVDGVVEADGITCTAATLANLNATETMLKVNFQDIAEQRAIGLDSPAIAKMFPQVFSACDTFFKKYTSSFTCSQLDKMTGEETLRGSGFVQDQCGEIFGLEIKEPKVTPDPTDPNL